jgi:hypothetical protein
MIVKDVLDGIRALPNYVTNSLVIKGSDSFGCTYKYLISDAGLGKRKEVFIATDSEESEGEGRTVITSIEVVPAE